jgi:hypothetical protein
MIINRRDMLQKTSCGFGFLGLASMLAKQSYGSDIHFPAKAKRVIFIYLNGGPSHVDTFDYKPLLDSKTDSQDPVDKNRKLLKSQAKFSASGESGLMISDFFPELQNHSDDLCLINGMYTDSGNHEQARSFLHTGNFQFVRPSMGSWLVYGLGTENEELPGFITINATIGPNDYGSAFLPAAFQGTAINAGNIKNAIPNLSNSNLSIEQQRKNLDLLQKINNLKLYNDSINSNLEALIKSYELAFKMQSSVPSVMDISGETNNILSRYGVGEKETDNFGKQCLMARKFAEAGVRFIEIGIGTWDFHQDIQKNMTTKCQAIDKPIAALLSDLKESGMLEETLVICGGEFGRTPGIQPNATGRDHNHLGYSIWMVGGGIKGGIRYGATDDFGHKAIENKMSVHDLHATILHLMGLDHTRLTYRYSGRDFRLTDVYGNVHQGVIA